MLVMVAGLLWLGRNFSVVPQYRRLVADGPYSLIRHPIYSSYLLFDGVLACEIATPLAGVMWLAEVTLLTLRARLEERLLVEADAGYSVYLAHVRWRFLPYVY